MYTKEKEARWLELTRIISAPEMPSDEQFSEAIKLEVERNEFVQQQLERQGDTRERLSNEG